MVITKYLKVNTKGHTDVIDITGGCQNLLSSTDLRSGIINIFNPGSTGSITTIEYEPNLVKDFKDALEVVAPSDKVYAHSMTWHDDNGSSHIRSTLMGPSLTVPFVDGELVLGTWQQIIFCDFDTRSRSRKLVIQIIGE